MSSKDIFSRIPNNLFLHGFSIFLLTILTFTLFAKPVYAGAEISLTSQERKIQDEELLEVTVHLDVKESRVYGATIILDYNAKSLEFVELIDDKSVFPSTINESNAPKSGVVSITRYMNPGEGYFTGNGYYSTVRFRLLNKDSFYVKVSERTILGDGSGKSIQIDSYGEIVKGESIGNESDSSVEIDNQSEKTLIWLKILLFTLIFTIITLPIIYYFKKIRKRF